VMPEAQDPNAQMLAAAVEKLVPLLDRIVFVGGCATGLLITDPGASPVRPTLDVDAIIDLASYAQFADLENRLQDLGFQPSHVEGAPICRWTHQDLVLDLMPTDSSILGFSNRWYHMALQNSETTRIGTHKIRLITAPYFLATKLEALHGRGQHDYRLSRDLEDIVTVIDGRPEIVNEVQETEDRLRQYLSDELSTLLADRNFMESLPGHLLPDAASQQRLRIVLHRIEQIAQKG
jgi:predicted nucleotidyltransferase